MVYCSHCGAQIADDSYFCPKCGNKTLVGKSAKVSYPSDEIEETFYRVGAELEKALKLAVHETHDALKRASEHIQRTTSAQPSEVASETAVVCPHCSAENISSAIFCHSCGKRIEPETSSGNK
jgi:uncharacterized membrane protein YvbJ